MDRQIIYPGQIPLDTDQLLQSRNALVSVGHVNDMLYGAGTISAGGFACTPGSGFSVVVAPGSILNTGAIDDTAYGSLPAVSSLTTRQYIMRDPTTLAVPSPGATYYVYALAVRSDTGAAVLPFYNASNPSQALAGPGNNGQAQPSVRQDVVGVGLGPSVPNGAIGLWTITVPGGATSITQSMIAQAPGAPFQNTIPQLAPLSRPVFVNGVQVASGNLAVVSGVTCGSLSSQGNIVSQAQLVCGTGVYTQAGYLQTNADFLAAGTDPIKSKTQGCMIGGGGVSSFPSAGSASGYFAGYSGSAIIALFGTNYNNIGNISNSGNSSVSYNTTSDYRLKENVAPITVEEAKARFAALRPVEHTWKSNPEDGVHLGFIAHELQEVYPKAVHGQKDAVNDEGNIVAQGVDLNKGLPADTVVLINHLLSEFAKLRAEISALKGAKS